MIVLRPHRVWIVTLCLALGLMFFSTPLLGFLRAEAAQNLSSQKAARIKTEKSLQQLGDDIEATKKLGSQMDLVEAARVLAPVDRLQSVTDLEVLARNMRLSHFTYSLTPEQKTAKENLGAESQELAVSTLTLSADVPLDRDGFAFLQKLGSVLAGRVQMQTVSLERSNHDAPLSDANLHMKATVEWLSNGEREIGAEK